MLGCNARIRYYYAVCSTRPEMTACAWTAAGSRSRRALKLSVRIASSGGGKPQSIGSGIWNFCAGLIMDPRSLTKDFREFLQCLNARDVEFLVIGGHAVAFHGYPRATADLDVWIAINPSNAARVTAALQDFGFNVPDLSPDLFLQENRIIRMGVAPNRIEIQTGIDGVRFSDCYPRRITSDLDGVPVGFISLADLKRNKAASARNKDLADLDQLP